MVDDQEKRKEAILAQAAEDARAAIETAKRNIGIRLAIVGKNHSQVAEEYGLHKSNLSRTLNSENVTVKTLCLMGRLVGLSIYDLLSPQEGYNEREGEDDGNE